MKNNNNIKYYYFLEFISFYNSLTKYPEMEVRKGLVERYFTQAFENKYLASIISVYMQQLLQGETIKLPLISTCNNSEVRLKLNINQLQYSAQKVNTSTELQESVVDFVSSCDNSEIEQFLIKFYKRINVFSLDRNTLQEFYGKFSMAKHIPKIKLTDFNYEVVKSEKVKVIRKLKYPVVLFASETINTKYFYKIDGKVVTNFEDVAFVSGVFANYKRISIIGNFVDNTLECYICTCKKKIVEKFIEQKPFTLQNSIRYLNNDFGRVNNTMKAYKDLKQGFIVKKALGEIYFNEEGFVEELVKRPNAVAFFRNDILDLTQMTMSRFVVTDLDYVGEKVQVQNIISKVVEEFDIGMFGEQELHIGSLIILMRLGENKFIKIKEGKC